MTVANISARTVYQLLLARPHARLEPRQSYGRHSTDAIRLIKANQHRRRKLNHWLKQQSLTSALSILEQDDRAGHLIIQAPPLVIKQLTHCPYVAHIKPIGPAHA